MTNKERLIALMGFAPKDNQLEGALIDAGVGSANTYTIDDKANVRRAAIYLLQQLLSTPDTGNSDPNFYIKYDRAAVQRRLDDLLNEVDPEQVLVPTIRGRCVW